MRKLTKKNLDELASSMSAISEPKQQSLIGGSFYFNDSGVFLGERGTGNDIIIASSLYDSGIPFSIASPETVSNVLTTMANGIGISGNIDIGYHDGVRYASTDPNTGQITFNITPT